MFGWHCMVNGRTISTVPWGSICLFTNVVPKCTLQFLLNLSWPPDCDVGVAVALVAPLPASATRVAVNEVHLQEMELVTISSDVIFLP